MCALVGYLLTYYRLHTVNIHRFLYWIYWLQHKMPRTTVHCTRLFGDTLSLSLLLLRVCYNILSSLSIWLWVRSFFVCVTVLWSYIFVHIVITISTFRFVVVVYSSERLTLIVTLSKNWQSQRHHNKWLMYKPNNFLLWQRFENWMVLFVKICSN